MARLRNFFYEKYKQDSEDYCIVYNLGIPGNTTEYILERFEFETKQRMVEEPEEIIIIFDFGGNDAAFIHSKNELWVV